MSVPPSCLIVDDDHDILDTLIQFFKSKDFECETAVNGLDAFKKLQARKPSLLLTDLAMPEMNGIELIKKIRDELGDGNLPIIVLSGNLSEFTSDLALFKNLEIIEKPFPDNRMDELLKKVLPTGDASGGSELGQKQLFDIATKDLVTSLGILCKQEPDMSEEADIQAPHIIDESIIFTYTFCYSKQKYRFHFALTHEWARMATGALLAQATVRDVDDSRMLEIMSDLNSTIASKMIKSFNASDSNANILSTSLFYNLGQPVFSEIHQKVTIHKAQFTTLFGYVDFYLYPLLDS